MYPMVMDMPMTIVERYAMNDARCMMLYDYLFKVEEEEGFGATLRTGLHDQISKAESVSLQMAKEQGRIDQIFFFRLQPYNGWCGLADFGGGKVLHVDYIRVPGVIYQLYLASK
jgi:hypothetical protein